MARWRMRLPVMPASPAVPPARGLRRHSPCVRRSRSRPPVGLPSGGVVSVPTGACRHQCVQRRGHRTLRGQLDVARRERQPLLPQPRQVEAAAGGDIVCVDCFADRHRQLEITTRQEAPRYAVAQVGRHEIRTRDAVAVGEDQVVALAGDDGLVEDPAFLETVIGLPHVLQRVGHARAKALDQSRVSRPWNRRRRPAPRNRCGPAQRSPAVFSSHAVSLWC